MIITPSWCYFVPNGMIFEGLGRLGLHVRPFCLQWKLIFSSPSGIDYCGDHKLFPHTSLPMKNPQEKKKPEQGTFCTEYIYSKQLRAVPWHAGADQVQRSGSCDTTCLNLIFLYTKRVETTRGTEATYAWSRCCPQNHCRYSVHFIQCLQID